MNYSEIKSFLELIDFFKLLPGVGEKTAERYAFSVLNIDEESLKCFGEKISSIKSNITTCKKCGCLTNTNNCINCLKDSTTVCVVENQKNVFTLSKSGINNVKYHVLGGLISPMAGINPEDIAIGSLIETIEKEKIDEVILALKPGIEGNTTSLYIKKILEDKKVKVTQIAQGVPIGTDMEYLDNLTLELALENRSEIS